MYLSQPFNERKMYQYVSGWKNSRKDQEKQLNEFLFRASSADLNLIRITVLSQTCIDIYIRHENEFRIKDNRVAFWSPFVTQILAEFNPLLSALRIMQDSIFVLAAHADNPRSSVPPSINKAMNKGLDKYNISENICEIITDYWNKNGLQLKRYRDLDTHYFMIAQHVLLQVIPEKNLLIFLPDDPAEQSRSNCTFDKEIEAFPYFRKAFFGVHNFAERLAKELGFKPSELKDNILMHPVQTQEGVDKTLLLTILSESNILELCQTTERKIYIYKVV